MRIASVGVAAGVALAVSASGAHAEGSIVDAIAYGKPILEVRARYEGVDQANIARDAEAYTVRTHLGWETADWNGFKALVEGESVQSLGADRFNSNLNGRTAYPIVADPDVTEINRLQITWTPSKAFTGTLGRQRILLDDQRFVGNVGWRQDEQTFDAVRGDVAIGKFKLTAAYLDRINRIVAEKGDWHSDSWIVNGSYAVSGAFKATGFLYALDFREAPASSSRTAGVRLQGAFKADGLGFAWAATYAHQTDYRNNPGDFGLDYWAGEVSATYKIATVRAAYEQLEGDGVRGFSTPLATLHAFQGWADVFLTTPANGIEDRNLTLLVKPPFSAPYLSKVELTARYHSFEAQRTGADLGDEVDLMAQAAVNKHLSVVAKFADYDGVPGFPSRRKVWLGFEFKL